MYALYPVLRSLNNFQNGKAQFWNTGRFLDKDSTLDSTDNLRAMPGGVSKCSTDHENVKLIKEVEGQSRLLPQRQDEADCGEAFLTARQRRCIHLLCLRVFCLLRLHLDLQRPSLYIKLQFPLQQWLM